MKIYLLRHAETDYNKNWTEFKKKYNIGEKERHFCNILRYIPDKDLIDNSITDFGKKMTLKNREENLERIKKIKTIIISPMSRALETARIYFDSHNSKIKKIVHPSLRSNFESQYDIPLKFGKNIEKFKEYDFDLISSLFKKYGFEWFIHDLGNNYKKNLLLKFLKNKNFENNFEKTKEIIKIMRDLCPEFMEEPIDINHRMFFFKKWLSNFLIEGNYKDFEVCLVAHKTVFKYFMATEFNKNGIPLNYKVLDNSELYEFEFDL